MNIQQTYQAYTDHVLNTHNTIQQRVHNLFTNVHSFIDSNYDMTIYVVLGLLALTIGNLLYRYGILKAINIDTQSLPAARAIYINYRGSYDKLDKVFTSVSEVTGTEFKISKMFGIYYDDPKKLQNPKQCRSTIGIIVNEGQRSKVDKFLANNPTYKQQQLPRTACLSTVFPFIDKLSIMLLYLRVYPRVAEQIKNRRLQDKIPGFMEIYHFLSNSTGTRHVQVLVPLENQEAFSLWEDDQFVRNSKRLQ